MAISKLILNNTTQMDLTADTVTTSDHIMEGYVGHLANGTSVTGTGKIAASEQAALDALVRYSNEVTGESDTTISEAVETLVGGYGGGEYTIEDIAEGALRNIEEVTIKSVTLETKTFSDSLFKIIHLPNAVTMNGRPFNGSNVELIDIPNVENLGDAFYNCSKLSGSYGEDTGVLRLPKVITANTYAFYNTRIKSLFYGNCF